MTHKILHISVNYKNDEQTRNFLRKIMSLPGSESVLFCVVNNSAKSVEDDSFSEFAMDARFRLINAPANLGYFGAAQMAYLRFKDHFSDWCLVSNTDMRIEDDNFYEKLLGYQVSENLGVLAPAIISEITKKDSNPYMKNRPQKGRMHFYAVIFSNYLLCQIYQTLAYFKDQLRSFLSVGSDSSIGRSIYAAQGAFFIFNKRYFAKGEDLSHASFLYGEEITVAEKCRRQNLEIQYEPELRVWHQEHGAIGLRDFFLGRNIFEYRKESSRKIYELFFKG
jgi:GT2 family glycosyltransferase